MAEPTPLNALLDPEFRAQFLRGMRDAGNRGGAMLLGGPVDAASGVFNAALMAGGYLGNKAGLLRADQMPMPVEAPVGGSEWIGRQMEQRGLVSSARNPVAEFLTSMLIPGAMMKGGRALSQAQDVAVANAQAPNVVNRGGAAKQRGIFMGDMSATWNKEAAAKAQALEKAGADPRAIWQETGTFKGADGKWRQEIDDSASKLREYQFTPQEAFKNAMYKGDVADADSHTRALAMRPYAGMTKTQLTDEYSRTGGEIVDAALGGDKAKALQLVADRAGLDGLLGAMRDRSYGPMSAYLKHGDLGQAYPDVYKLHTRITDELGEGTRGQYMRAQHGVGEQIQLGTKPTWSGDKSTMLHELQHVVQERQGFARGGSPEAMRDEALKMLRRDVGSGEIESTERAMSMLPMYQQNAYRRLAGEAEARAVQARMNMTAAERRANFPFDSYDVPVNSLIVR